MKIIFCDSVINPRAVEPDYEAERKAALAVGLEPVLISFEELTMGNVHQALRYVPVVGKEERAIYRGWMLTPALYEVLYKGLLTRNIRLINDPEAYRHCHYLPESYALIEGHTPESVWMEVKEDFGVHEVFPLVRQFGDSPLIVKDYVKSEKHFWETACFIPAASDEAKVKEVVAAFLALRESELNEGLVFRKFEKLTFLTQHSQSDMPLTLEYRLIFANKTLIAVLDYWEEGDYGTLEPPVADFLPIAHQIQSNFFTMDIAQKADGGWIIIELGDGQVAGLPDHADKEAVYRKLKEVF